MDLFSVRSYTMWSILQSRYFLQFSIAPNLIHQLNAQRKNLLYTRIWLIFFIGWLKWGSFDISYEVSVLSRYLVHPWTGHIVQAFHMFNYLDIHRYRYLVFNPTFSEFSHPLTIDRKIKQIKKMYPDVVKDFPPNDPPPGGNPNQVSSFIDSNHAGDKITHHSRSGTILYCNKHTIVWYSTVESSTVGYKFLVLQVASELSTSLHYKLRMFSIPILGHAGIFCDNEYVYNNTAFSEWTLKKKLNSFCFHSVR